MECSAASVPAAGFSAADLVAERARRPRAVSHREPCRSTNTPAGLSSWCRYGPDHRIGSGLLVQMLRAGLRRLSRWFAGIGYRCEDLCEDLVTLFLAVLIAAAGTTVIWMGWSVAHSSGGVTLVGSPVGNLVGILLGLFLVFFLAYGAYVFVNNRTMERDWLLQELRRAAAERASWLGSGGWLPAWETYQDDLICSDEAFFFLEWGGLLAAVEPSEGGGYTWYVDLWALPVGLRFVPTLHAGFSRSESSAKRAAMRWLVVELRRPVDGLEEAEAVAQ